MTTKRNTSQTIDDHAHRVWLDSLHEERTRFASATNVLDKARRAFAPPQRPEKK